MKFAVISDVHSNIEALNAVKADIESQGITTVYCLGDTLGYGPYPLECLNAVLSMCSVVLKGNHEDTVCNPRMEYDLNRFASEGVRFSRSKLTKEIIEGIGKFPSVRELPDIDFVLCHGSYTGSPMWDYIDSPSKAKSELRFTPRRICLVGHTHNPFVFGDKSGLYETLPDDLELDPKQKYLINVGSVGQPRDGDCRSCYATFDISEDKITFNLRRVFYNIEAVEKAISEAGISMELAERLFCGE